MSGKIYGFLEENSEDPCSINKFVRKYYDTLENIVNEAGSSIIISDLSPSGMFIYKFLRSLSYKNVIIYHLGKFPNYNPENLPTLKFKNKEKLIATIISSSTEIIYL